MRDMPHRFSTQRHRMVILTGLLAVAAIATWWATRDPEVRLVEQAVREYVGDLKAQNLTSASRRIFPDDLLELKEAALFKAGIQESFRAEALEFFQARDLDEVRRASRERFFEFLLLRTFVQHRRLFGYLAGGQIAGVQIQRDGDEARALVSVDVDVPEGRRRLTMKAGLIKRDGVWWIRI